MNYPTVSVLLVMGLLSVGKEAMGGALATPGPPPTLTLTSCQLEDPAKVSVVPAECGDLSVPENPADPGGRHIKLRVARVPAINRHKQADPLFVLAGGPGMAATTFYASAAFSFERIHRDRDIVLVDQRGTGQSNPLNCALDDDALDLLAELLVCVSRQGCLPARPRR